MTTIVAFANRKGGVGKTTAVINVAHALVADGQRVLVVDMDAQANASTGLGLLPETVVQYDDEGRTIYHALTKGASVRDVIYRGEGIDLVPASQRLGRINMEMQNPYGIFGYLKKLLAPVLPEYDMVLIDCPPSAEFSTTNALALADYVVIPVKTDLFSVMGVKLMLEDIAEAQDVSNPNLKVLCILPTQYAVNITKDNQFLEILRKKAEAAGIPIFEPVRAAAAYNKALAEGSSVVRSYPATPGADQYLRIAQQLIDVENAKKTYAS